MSTDMLAKIAADVAPTLGGVDWAALEKALNVPKEEVVYHTGLEVSNSGAFMYVAYLQAAHDRAWKALQDAQIQLSWDIKDNPATAENEVVLAYQSWQSVQRDTMAVSDVVLQAMESNVDFLSTDHAMLVDLEKLRAVVSSVYMVALYGAVTHKELMLQMANVAPEDIIESADNITRSFNALTTLVEMGVLNPLKKDATKALGVLPQVIIIAILVVAGIGIIAWCIIAVMKQIEVNKAIKLMCEEAARTGSVDDKNRCAKLAEMSQTSTSGGPPMPFGDIGKIAMWVGIAAGVIIMGPTLMRFLNVAADRKAAS